MNFFLIAFSFIVSTILSVKIMRIKNNRWLGILSAFCVNTIMLVISALFLYSLGDESVLFGIDIYSRYVLVIAIPIITWINFLILTYVSHRRDKVK